MIPVKRLPIWRPFQGIEDTGIFYNRSPDCKTALVFDKDWFGPGARIPHYYWLLHMITPQQLTMCCFLKRIPV
jgi:hypothetical protein